jgi:hypothetical protein
VFLKLLQKAVTLGIVLEPDRDAACIVWRIRWRCAKFAYAQSTHPWQSRPAQLPYHFADFAFGRKR